METSRPLRIVLCVYESFRLAFLVGAFVALQPEGALSFPWLSVLTPGALFLLMAVFWLLDVSRCRLYCPLYLAGKGLGIFTMILWLFFTGNGIIKELVINGAVSFILPGIAAFLLLGDMISVWVAAKLMEIK